MRRLLPAALLLGLLLACDARAQAPVPVFGEGPIPDQPFTSWSLFLPCNPAWLVDRQANALREVFAAYRAFAMTSGPRHAAVWFVRPRPGERTSVAAAPENLDIERSASYCQRFGLVPSEGPHVIVTTTHPDRWAPGTSAPGGSGDPVVILALGGSGPADVVRLLARLNDQVIAEQLSQTTLASEQYWRGWVRVLERACRFFDKAKFVVSVKALSIEKVGLCN